MYLHYLFYFLEKIIILFFVQDYYFIFDKRKLFFLGKKKTLITSFVTNLKYWMILIK